MQFAEFLGAIDDSTPPEWLSVSRPIFKQDLGFGSGGGREPGICDLQEHYAVYTLKSNLSISINTGLRHLEDFRPEWSVEFPDKSVSSDFIDLCWNGNVVYRGIRVLVDGGRAGLPTPRFGTYEVARLHSNIWRLVDQLGGSSEYDRYFSMAGLHETNEPWPRD